MIRINLILLTALIFPVMARGGEMPPRPLKHDGFLRLYHSHLDEILEVTYEKEGVVDPAAMKKINRFMRSRDSGQQTEMDVDLIRLIDHLGDHFGVDTVEIICGYRSPEFNRSLKEAGKNVAEKSNHMKGIAADIHLDEISEKKIQAYARRLGIGGVGYYPDQLMVHVDLGRVHFWQGGNFSDRTDIGIFNRDLNLALTTDHLFYFDGDEQKMTLSNPENLPLKPEMVLEHFHRGGWSEIKIPPGPPFSKGRKFLSPLVEKESAPPPLKKGGGGDLELAIRFGADLPLPFGKFRWKIVTGDGRVQYSNEFYVKKK